MKVATLIIFVLSNQGYWLSNQPATVSVQWNAAAGNPASDIEWKLMIGSVPLAGGRAAMPEGDRSAAIAINCPQVRVRTMLRFVYRVVQRDGGKELEHGEVPIHLFPLDLSRGWSDLFRDKKLAVIDVPEHLPRLLDAAKVPYARFDDASRIDAADVILVGEDQLDDSTFGQAALLTLAQQGRSVMIFRQSKPTLLANYPVQTRPAPAKLAWKLDHPLFEQLAEADLQSWLIPGTSLQAIEIPADEPALELAYWPRETPGKTLSPIEALVVTKSLGVGRIVLFNVPLGDWQSDPRRQVVLGNALSYLLTPSQPTLKPSERDVPTTQKAIEPSKPSGDRP